MAGPPPPVRVYCARCGAGMLSDTARCPACSAPNLAAARPAEPSSDRSYSLAVMLCGIFGIVGIHHFYMGNWLHGLFDLGLFLVAVYILAFSAADGDGWMAIGLLLLAVDFLHTMIVFYRLIAGKARDGQGRPIAVPTARP